MNTDAEFIAMMIITFLDGHSSVESLNNYYRLNIQAITTVKSLDVLAHDKVINAFKAEKQRILLAI